MANDGLSDLWCKRLNDFARSGLSVRKWCEENGVTECQHTYWRRKLAAADAANTIGAGWLPVAITEALPLSIASTAPVGLTIRIGVAQIDLAPGFDPALLRAVVAALGTPETP